MYNGNRSTAGKCIPAIGSNVFFTLFLLILTIATSAQSVTSGLTAHAGTPFPADNEPGVQMKREIIRLKRLDTLTTLDMLFEMHNLEAEYKSVQVVSPVAIYIDEFRPEYRTGLLKELAGFFPDLFKVQQEYTDIRPELRSRFGKRLFVRRFLSSLDLAKMGINLTMMRGNDKLDVQKIMLEFRWTAPGQLGMPDGPDVLVLNIHFFNEWLFKPDETAQFKVRLRIPALNAGADHTSFYLPFEMGATDRWNGQVDRVYLLADLLEATMVIPNSLAFEQHQYGHSESLAIIDNYTPKRSDKIAFFSDRQNINACNVEGLGTDRFYFPPSIVNIGASSWIDRDKMLEGYFVENSPSIATSNVFPDYQHALDSPLLIFKNIKQSVYDNPLSSHMLQDCEGEPPGTRLQGYCHPMFAFDFSRPLDPDRSETDAFYLKTAWCENVSGNGEGQKLHFELLQPATALRIFNGYQISEDRYQLNSRARVIELRADNGDITHTLPVSDLKILNLYELNLPAGAYTLQIKRSFQGKYPVTCLSSVHFDFTLDDSWFRTHYPVF